MDHPLSNTGSEAPLIIFLHIPKTAGTTVNHILAQSGLAGQDHFQNWFNRPIEAQKKLALLDWISGHATFQQMRAFAAQHSARHMRLFSAMRSPISQIASHYNWLIEIFHKSTAFYEGHPQSIKVISERIRTSDNENPAVVIEQIKLAEGLFLNQQSRMLLGNDASQLSEEQILNRLQAYEFVATEQTLDLLIEKMIGAATPILSYENKSGYHFDPAVFRTPQMQEFLSEHHKTDMVIYDILMRHGGCFPPSKSFASEKAGLISTGQQQTGH